MSRQYSSQVRNLHVSIGTLCLVLTAMMSIESKSAALNQPSGSLNCGDHLTKIDRLRAGSSARLSDLEVCDIPKLSCFGEIPGKTLNLEELVAVQMSSGENPGFVATTDPQTATFFNNCLVNWWNSCGERFASPFGGLSPGYYWKQNDHDEGNSQYRQGQRSSAVSFESAQELCSDPSHAGIVSFQAAKQKYFNGLRAAQGYSRLGDAPATADQAPAALPIAARPIALPPKAARPIALAPQAARPTSTLPPTSASSATTPPIATPYGRPLQEAHAPVDSTPSVPIHSNSVTKPRATKKVVRNSKSTPEKSATTEPILPSL